MGRKKLQLKGGFLSASLNVKTDFRTYLAKLMGRKHYSNFNLFADIVSGLRIEEDSSISTFCVTVKDGHYLMKYSPTMVEELDVLGAGIVIAHELGHLTLDHIPRWLRLEQLYLEDTEKLLKLRAVMHVASDYALNSWLIDVTKVFTLQDLKCRVGKPVEGTDFKGMPLGSYAGIHPSDSGLPTKKSLEFYVEELSKKIVGGQSITDTEPSEDSSGTLSEALEAMTPEQLEELIKASGISEESLLQSLQDNGELDASGDGGDEGLSVEELASNLEREAKQSLKDAVESIKSRGVNSGNKLVSWLDDYLAPPKVRWQDILKSITATAKPFSAVRSMRRPRRRGALLPGSSPFPGKIKDPSYTIVMAIDTSASVSNVELGEIFAELDSLGQQPSTEILVVQCDILIRDVAPYTGTIPHVKGRGGTEFNPVFKWLSSAEGYSDSPPKNIDLLIYATDGECPLPSTALRFLPSHKVVWLLSSRGSIPVSNSWRGTTPTEVSGECEYGSYIFLGDCK